MDTAPRPNRFEEPFAVALRHAEDGSTNVRFYSGGILRHEWQQPFGLSKEEALRLFPVAETVVEFVFLAGVVA